MHERPLPDGEPDKRPMVDRLGEDLPRLVQVAAGVQHVVNPRAVLSPLLDLVKVAVVRDERRWSRRLTGASSFRLGRTLAADRSCRDISGISFLM